MDRHGSISSVNSAPSRTGLKQLPPWEVPALPQVPYMVSSAQPLSAPEKEALPSLWATRTSNASTLRPQRDLVLPNSPKGSPWISSGYNTPRRPPTPPSSGSSAFRSESAPAVPAYERSYSPPSSEHKRPVMALPGTMSSRSVPAQSPARSREVSSSRKQSKRGKRREDVVPLGRRLRTAMKDLFRKDPVDESQFERIDDRHWTE